MMVTAVVTAVVTAAVTATAALTDVEPLTVLAELDITFFVDEPIRDAEFLRLRLGAAVAEEEEADPLAVAPVAPAAEIGFLPMEPY